MTIEVAEEIIEVSVEDGALVVNVVEDITEVVLGAAGPQGVPGPQGEQGEQGEQGPPGELVVEGGISEETFDAHVNSETPHPSYDNYPSLSVKVLNALA